MSDPAGEFRQEVEYLASRASEARGHEPIANPLEERRPLRKFLWLAALIALVQVGFLVYFSIEEQHQRADRHVRPNPLLFQQDCQGEKYRTYRRLMAYVREHGALPDSLEPLVGTVFSTIPTDPVTKKPLRYTKEGGSFRLECP